MINRSWLHITKHCLLILLMLFFSTSSMGQGNVQAAVYQGISYRFYSVDVRTSNLAFHWKNEQGQPMASFGSLADELKKEGKDLTFATNGGIFSPNLNPVGLYIENGKLLNSLNNKEGNGNYFLKPNGVFYITKNKEVAVVESGKYTQSAAGKNIEYALQSGPQLLIDGKIHPEFTPNSTNKHIRSGVGVVNQHMVVFAISEAPVNLYEFAGFFQDIFRCPNALYLDGTISSMAWAEGNKIGVSNPAIRSFSVMISDSQIGSKKITPTPVEKVPNVDVSMAKGFQYNAQNKTIASFQPSEYRIEIKNSADFSADLGSVSEFFWAWRESLSDIKGVPKNNIYAMYGLGYGSSKSNFLIYNGKELNTLLMPNILGNGVFGVKHTGKIDLLDQEEYKQIENTNTLKHAITIGHFLLKNGNPTDYVMKHQTEIGYYAAVGIKKSGEVVMVSTDKADGKPGAKVQLIELVKYFIANDCQQVALLAPKDFAYSSVSVFKPNWNAKIDRSQIPGIIAIIKK